MNPAAIIREATVDGVTLALSPAGTLKATGDASAVNRWLPILKAHKPGILAALQEAANESMPASRWWLIHFPDREPLEVACFPDTTHAEMLARYPEAIAAEPQQYSHRMPDAGSLDMADFPWPEPVAHHALQPLEITCKTCSQVCRSGCCGAPVAAGLSDLEGVIYYHPKGGTDCPAWKGKGHD